MKNILGCVISHPPTLTRAASSWNWYQNGRNSWRSPWIFMVPLIWSFSLHLEFVAQISTGTLQNTVCMIPSGSTWSDQEISISLMCSGVNLCSTCRDMALFKTDQCKTAKLFAKHMKVSPALYCYESKIFKFPDPGNLTDIFMHFQLKDQVKFLKSKSVHIGYGTPNRIASLLDCGELSVSYSSLSSGVPSWSELCNEELLWDGGWMPCWWISPEL